MSDRLNLTLDPKPNNQSNMARPGDPLRFYESSIGDLVSVSMAIPFVGPEGGRLRPRALQVGLRLDREQVTELHEALGKWLGEFL